MSRGLLLAIGFLFWNSSLSFAGDDTPFLHFTLGAEGLPASVIGDPVDDTEVELERFAGGIEIEAETRGLIPFHAYTIWALVFNNPDGCNDDCGIADDIGPNSGFSALWSGVGFVADEDGEAHGFVSGGEGASDAVSFGDASLADEAGVAGAAAGDEPELDITWRPVLK